MYKPESVRENEMYRIHYNIDIQTDQSFSRTCVNWNEKKMSLLFFFPLQLTIVISQTLIILYNIIHLYAHS